MMFPVVLQCCLQGFQNTQRYLLDSAHFAVLGGLWGSQMKQLLGGTDRPEGYSSGGKLAY